MSKSAPIKSKVLSIRLSDEEWERLQKEATGLYYSDYVRKRLFGDDVRKLRTRSKSPVKDHKLLSKVLGQLGQSKMANNLNQIAHAANCGALMLNPELRALLIEACTDIREIRDMIMKALGLSG